MLASNGEGAEAAEEHMSPSGSPHVQFKDVGICETEPLIDKSTSEDPKTHAYARRWYMLFIFSAMAIMQSAIWNTWGPIADSSTYALGWGSWQIFLLPNWGTIAFIPTLFLFSYLLDVKGLRWGVLSCAFFVFLGAAVRCFSVDTVYGQVLINFGQFLNGLGGPTCMAGPPVLSSVYFLPGERTTATSVAALSGYLGVALSFLVGPLLVREPPKDTGNNNTMYNVSTLAMTTEVNFTTPPIIYSTTNHTTAPLLTNTTSFWGNTSSAKYMTTTEKGNKSHHVIDEIKSDIRYLMYYEAGIMAVIFVAILIYFPAAPPLPPSISAAKPRDDYISGIKQLIRSGRFWLITLSYGIPLGVYGCWGTVLDKNLQPLKVDENTAGWLGFYSQLGGVVAAIIGARVADIFSGHLKLIIICITFAALAFCLWMTLIISQIISFSVATLYISIIGGGCLLNSMIPLFFEIAVEASYPIGEGTTGGMMTLINNLAGCIFLSVPYIPNIGTQWMNWTVCGTVALTIPLMFSFRERYLRLDVDTHGDHTHARQHGANS